MKNILAVGAVGALAFGAAACNDEGANEPETTTQEVETTQPDTGVDGGTDPMAPEGGTDPMAPEGGLEGGTGGDMGGGAGGEMGGQPGAGDLGGGAAEGTGGL